MTADTRKGTALALLASAQWGATGIWVALLRDLPTGTTLVFRFLTATALLTVLLALARGFRRPNRAALEGGVLLATYYVLATVGFYLSDVVTVSLLVATSPFFVMLLRLWRRESLGGQEVLGGLLAFAGVAMMLLIDGSGRGGDEQHLAGDLCGLGAALVMALYSRAGDRLRGQGWNVVWIACALGLLVSVPFANPAGAVPDATQWALFLGLAAFSTLAPGYLYPLACQHINATSATVVRLSTPFFTTLFALLVLGNALGIQHLLGAPLLLLGVYLTLPR